MKRIAALALVAVTVLGLGSCILDPKPKPIPPGPGTNYLSIDTTEARDNVLFNLEKAYTERNIQRYDQLLDADFIFHFSPADVQNHNVDFEFWDRAHEINANRNMFDRNYSSPTQDPVSSISLTLTYAEGDDQWLAFPPEDPVKFAGETWYRKTVDYDLSVQAGDWTYVGQNLKAAFVVRVANIDGKYIWRIVVWKDDVNLPLFGFLASDQTEAAAAQESTWGGVKALFTE